MIIKLAIFKPMVSLVPINSCFSFISRIRLQPIIFNTSKCILTFTAPIISPIINITPTISSEDNTAIMSSDTVRRTSKQTHFIILWWIVLITRCTQNWIIKVVHWPICSRWWVRKIYPDIELWIATPVRRGGVCINYAD